MIFSTTVLGGLPCKVEARYEKPDPSVGYMGGYWEIENIQDMKGRYAEWIEKKLTEEDYEQIQQDAQEAAEYGLIDSRY